MSVLLNQGPQSSDSVGTFGTLSQGSGLNHKMAAQEVKPITKWPPQGAAPTIQCPRG